MHSSRKKTSIIVVTHKPIKFELPDYYQWIQVNAEKNGRWDGYLHDNDINDNISIKNNSYCELTALYSLWKNSDADIKGLCHYRRFLGNGIPVFHQMRHGLYLRKERIPFEVIKRKRIERLLKNKDILVPASIFPYPNTAHEDLLRFVYLKDINVMIDAVEAFFPDYVSALWKVLSSTNIHYCNMFIASKEVTDAYCSWLFDLLGKIENRIDISDYDPQHMRIFGYMAEVLLNVYIERHHLKKGDLEQIQLDEQDTPLSMKRKLVLFRHALYSFFQKVPPQKFRKELWYARIRHYQSADTAPSSSDKAAFLKALGGTGITSETGSAGDYLKAQYGDVIINAYFADDQNQMSKIAEALHPIEAAFSQASINRIFCTFPIDLSIVKDYARKGIFVYQVH